MYIRIGFSGKKVLFSDLALVIVKFCHFATFAEIITTTATTPTCRRYTYYVLPGHVTV